MNTIIMPNNYALLNNAEMEYLEAGATICQSGSASAIKNRITTMISACWAGNVAGIGLTVVGGLICKIGGAALAAWFSNTLTHLNSAHSGIEGIIRKHGKNRYCYLTSTWSGVWCTGFSVST